MTRRAALAILAGSYALARPPAEAAGALEGRVTDENGRAVADVILKARHTVRGVTATTASGLDGRYRFDELPPGAYSLYAAKPGYCSLWIRQVIVQPDQRTRRDLTLAHDSNCKGGGIR